ncbi:MAG: hypothetical protein JWR13_4335 [Mycobacterium sp.]|nr:hypothetical protein [Mycobacterium sp.]
MPSEPDVSPDADDAALMQFVAAPGADGTTVFAVTIISMIVQSGLLIWRTFRA